jgi:excinuclease UvrABC helicase subunit UvrB
MKGAITNPEEIKRFTFTLNQTIKMIREIQLQLMNKFEELENYWKDSKNKRFHEIFISKMQYLDEFLKKGENLVRYLHRKVEPLERYLQHRY